MGGSPLLKILLDTHVWVWRLLEPERLSRRLEEALAESGHELFLSPISVWETLVLARKGRLTLDPDPQSWVRTALRTSMTTAAPLSHEVAMRSEALPGFPSPDPADRFLAATALVQDLVLATADRVLRGYRPLPTLW